MTINTTQHAGTGQTRTVSSLELRLRKLADQAITAVMKAVGAAGRVADDNQGKVNEKVAQAGAAFDKRTQGKYAPKVAKACDAVNSGVARAAKYSDR